MYADAGTYGVWPTVELANQNPVEYCVYVSTIDRILHAVTDGTDPETLFPAG